MSKRTDPLAPSSLLEALRSLHARILSSVLEGRGAYDARPASESGDQDFAFEPDLVAEREIERFCLEWSQDVGPIRLVTEETDRVVAPEGTSDGTPRLRLLVDPIDGTRVFLRDLRSAWILSAVFDEPATGEPTLDQARVALQTEIPTRKQDLAEALFTLDGSIPRRETWNVRHAPAELVEASSLTTPTIDSIDHAFLVFCKFFPEGKTTIAAIEEAICHKLLTDRHRPDRSYFFEDQYLSTGGQLHCLATGRYAFVADLRPLLFDRMRARGRDVGIAGHPYDIATLRIASDAGVRFTDLDGSPLRVPANNHRPVGFLAYANDAIREIVEPTVTEVLANADRYVVDPNRNPDR